MLMKVLLKKVADYVEANPDEHGYQILVVGATHVHKTVRHMIETIDVRDIGVLRDFVPQAFPRKLRVGELWVHQNIHGLWRVDLMSDKKVSKKS